MYNIDISVLNDKPTKAL